MYNNKCKNNPKPTRLRYSYRGSSSAWVSIRILPGSRQNKNMLPPVEFVSTGFRRSVMVKAIIITETDIRSLIAEKQLNTLKEMLEMYEAVVIAEKENTKIYYNYKALLRYIKEKIYKRL